MYAFSGTFYSFKLVEKDKERKAYTYDFSPISFVMFMPTDLRFHIDLVMLQCEECKPCSNVWMIFIHVHSSTFCSWKRWGKLKPTNIIFHVDLVIFIHRMWERCQINARQSHKMFCSYTWMSFFINTLSRSWKKWGN